MFWSDKGQSFAVGCLIGPISGCYRLRGVGLDDSWPVVSARRCCRTGGRVNGSSLDLALGAMLGAVAEMAEGLIRGRWCWMLRGWRGGDGAMLAEKRESL